MIVRLIVPLAFAASAVLANEHAAPNATAENGEHAAVHAEAPGKGAAGEHAEAASLPTLPAVGSEKQTTPKYSIHPPSPKDSATPEEIASLLRIGKEKLERGDYVSSELAFRQVLAEKATKEQDLTALTGLARTYRKKSEFTKAAAVYETIIRTYPENPQLPSIYLELGRTQRALGAYKAAIGRFYNVLNSTLKLPEDNPDSYRQLARTAQFEIAETYFQAGDYEQASRYFSKLKLLDLAPEDRARAHFKSVYALTLQGDNEKAVAGFRSYLDQNPGDENVPEARYLLSVSLRKLGRYNESLAAALELLKAEKKYVDSNPKRWAYWQRKTGNQLANQFYEQGDFGSALIIYQNLASLSPEPLWRLPALYQVGLCDERLHLTDRARECYETITEATRNAANETPRRQEMVDLFEMADWRLKHLNWQDKTDKQLSAIFPNERERIANLTANDIKPDGSAEKSPGPVR
jgi:tetratricopeptide (TPR) repeat protein